MRELRSFLLISLWIGISLGYFDDHHYAFKFVGFDNRFQNPPSCGDYFRGSNFNDHIAVPDQFSIDDDYNRFDISRFNLKEGMHSSFGYPHQILNYYALYGHPYFKAYVKRNCDTEIVRSHLRFIKKRYCTEQDFHDQADRLPFNLFEAADNLLTEIGISCQPHEIEDFYREYKKFSSQQSPHATCYKKRCAALKRQYETTTRKNKLHPLTEKLLDENSKRVSKFQKFKGNAFQAQLYDEFVEILDRTSTLPSNSAIKAYVNDIVALVDVGQSFNREGFLVKAALIADCCWSFVTACAQGVTLGASDLVHFIVHPIDSTIESITSISSVVYHLGRLLYQIADASSLASLQHIELHYEGNYEALSNKTGIGLVLGNEANKKVRAFSNNCSSITKTLYEQCKDFSWTDKAKYFFAIGTPAFLTKKCTKVLHAIANKASMQSIQLVKDAHVITAEAALASPNAAMVKIIGQAAGIAHDLAEGKLFSSVSIDELRNIYSTYSTIKALQPNKYEKQSFNSYKNIEVPEKETIGDCFEPIQPSKEKPGCGDVQQPKIEDYILINPIPQPEEQPNKGCFKPIPIEIKPSCGGIKPVQSSTLILTQDTERETQTQKPSQTEVPPAESVGECDINQSGEAILKNGYYEVNGFKISEKYYNKLWTNGGRPAPTLIAKEILENDHIIKPDSKEGFMRYEYNGMEMIYNEATKEIWHIGYMR